MRLGNRAAIVDFSRGRQRAEFTVGRPPPQPSAPSANERAGAARPSLRRRSFTAVGTLGAVGVLAVPLPASAAPAPCEQAERYAAQSGSQILRINSLGPVAADTGTDDEEPDPTEGTDGAGGGTVGPLAHVGDAKSAMTGQGTVHSAAVARMIDVTDDDTAEVVTEPLVQQAPPTNKRAAIRRVAGTQVGPVSLGDGTLTTHARWTAGMACGATDGEVTRAGAQLRDARVLADGEGPLIRVPGVASESTTQLDRNGSAVTSVATAGLSGGVLDLLAGAVRVKIIEPPSLRVTMSTKDGGEVRYIPAIVEVSGDGVETSRLSTAGDNVEITLDPGSSDPGSSDPDSSDPDSSAPETGSPGSEASEELLESGDGASLPEVPEVPEISERATESAPVPGTETKVAVSLGDLRQAARGHAIAARATAVSVTITPGTTDARTRPGYSQVIELDMGVMEAAAVAPEPSDAAASTSDDGADTKAEADIAAGAGGGLPITGRPVGGIVLTGLAMVAAGATALILGLRGRSRS
ncbi:hypothetical protein [Actinoplanes sp. NPDC051494]|uniref:hypothetical protein n=1 Tax=Actinoplanes sp. NPDC051494 TaxID=3363907 RepID=UPI003797BCC4